MNQISVDFRFKSLDSTQAFTTTGEYKFGRITFQEPGNGDKHVIVVNTKTVEYYKSGSVDLHFTFDTSRLTKGSYTVYQHRFDFVIFTDVIVIDDYDVKVKYKLLQANEPVNEATLELHYDFLKEE